MAITIWQLASLVPFDTTDTGMTSDNVQDAIDESYLDSLHKAGGSFHLTSEVDFGTAHGLKAPYFKSSSVISSGVAQSGVIRLAVDDGVAWRDSGDFGDLVLVPSPDDETILTYNGIELIDATSPQNISNKNFLSLTLTSPTISGGTITNATITNPTFSSVTSIDVVNAEANRIAIVESVVPITVESGRLILNANTSGTLRGLRDDGTTLTYVDTTTTQTLTNKTLTSPVITGFTTSGYVLTLLGSGATPTPQTLRLIIYSDTSNLISTIDGSGNVRVLVDTSSTQTLAAKTLTSPVLNEGVFTGQGSTPSAPASGKYSLYVKTADGYLYIQDSSANEYAVSLEKQVAESDLGTLTWTAGTDPSGTVTKKYRAIRQGSKVDIWCRIEATTPGVTVTEVSFPLPTDAVLGTPASFTDMGNSEFNTAGSGAITVAGALPVAGPCSSYLGKDGSGVWTVYITGPSSSADTAFCHLTYFV